MQNMYSSITLRRSDASASFAVVTFLPSDTGVVHAAGLPFTPSISTTHKRHEPNASRETKMRLAISRNQFCGKLERYAPVKLAIHAHVGPTSAIAQAIDCPQRHVGVILK